MQQRPDAVGDTALGLGDDELADDPCVGQLQLDAAPTLVDEPGQVLDGRHRHADGGEHTQVQRAAERIRLAPRCRSGPVLSHTIPAEHLLLVGQLARVLDQEAGAADELVGLFG